MIYNMWVLYKDSETMQNKAILYILVFEFLIVYSSFRLPFSHFALKWLCLSKRLIVKKHYCHKVWELLSVTIIQLAKISLLPPKYEIIMVPSNHSNFQYYDSNIGLFSIAPCRVITLNPLCILFCISSLLLFWWPSL